MVTIPALIMVASPHALTVAGVAGLLRDAGYSVASVTGGFGALEKMASRERPDMVLVDGWMLEDNLAAIARLSERLPVALLVGLENGPLLREAMAAGAMGFISVDVDTTQFIESVRLLLRNALVISAKSGELMLEGAGLVADEKVIDHLSAHEKRLAIFVAGGRQQ